METMSRRKFNRIMKQRKKIETAIEVADHRIDFAKQYHARSKHDRFIAVTELKAFDARMGDIKIQETDGTTTNSWE